MLRRILAVNEISNAEQQLVKRYKRFLWFVSITIVLLLIPLFQHFYSPGIYKIILALLFIGLVVTYIAKNKRLLPYVRTQSEKYKLSFQKLYIGYTILYLIVLSVIVITL